MLETLVEIDRLVTEYFNYNDRKINDWYNAKNPILGDQRPIDMVRTCRVDKLHKAVLSLTKGDLP